MKVLYLIDTLEHGGTERSLLELTSHFKRVDPVVYQIYEGDALMQEFRKRHVRVVCCNLKKKHGYGRAVTNVLKTIKTEMPDLIHTSLARSNLIGRISGRLTNTPVISSFVNDSYSTARLEKLSPGLKRKLKMVQLLDRLTSGSVSHFIANSHATKDSNCESLGILSERVSVIYRGRNPEPFLLQKEAETLRKSLGIEEDAAVILNVGRLHPQKGQTDLLIAMQKITQKTKAHLLIAGEGPLRTTLMSRITELKLEGKVTLLGARTDVPDLLNLASIFAFPSYYEGHPGSLVEAMFAGKPIVASDIPVHRETIVHGQNGYLIPAGAHDDIASNVVRMLKNKNEADTVGNKAKESALEKFHIDKVVFLHEQLYERVLQNWHKGNRITKE